MNNQEMRAYISDIAHRLEDDQLLRMLYLRASTLAQMAETLSTQDTAADTRQKITTIENIHYLPSQLDADMLRKIYFLVLHTVGRRTRHEDQT